jgi:hypothetical protein
MYVYNVMRVQSVQHHIMHNPSCGTETNIAVVSTGDNANLSDANRP